MNSQLRNSFAEFLTTLQESEAPAAISPTQVAKALGLSIQELAAVLRVHRNTLATPGSPKVQAGLREIVRVLCAATALAGHPNRALFWFRCAPILDFDDLTPCELVQAGKSEAVLDYIRSISAGAAG